MTSATDNRTTELRRKLTELGKSYSTIDGEHKNTVWHAGGLTWWYDENTETGKTVLFTPKQYDVTPEQAIAATLGSEREKALEELVQDWQVLYEEPDHGDCCRLRKRMRELGIEVIDE